MDRGTSEKSVETARLHAAESLCVPGLQMRAGDVLTKTNLPCFLRDMRRKTDQSEPAPNLGSRGAEGQAGVAGAALHVKTIRFACTTIISFLYVVQWLQYRFMLTHTYLA